MFLNTFKQTIEKVPYRDKGIFYSELYLFLISCRLQGVDTILESGSLYGFSTEFISRIWPGYVYSVDKQRLHNLDFPNLCVIHGDSVQEIPRLIKQNHMAKVAVLIDGPKGDLALLLKSDCLKYNNVKVVGVHDATPGHGELFHSHASDLQEIRHMLGLDKAIKTDYFNIYPKGPGLAIWMG